MTPRARKAVAVLTIALVLSAAFLPALAASLGLVVFVPLQLVVPAAAAASLRRGASRSDERYQIREHETGDPESVRR